MNENSWKTCKPSTSAFSCKTYRKIYSLGALIQDKSTESHKLSSPKLHYSHFA